MTVFAVNMTKDDVSAAQAFGDIKYVNISYIFGDQLQDNINGNILPDEPWTALGKCADLFDQRRDYVLIAADHLQLVTLAAMLGRRMTWFRVLRYDRIAKGYLPVVIYT